MARYGIYRPRPGDPGGAFDELRREMDALLGRIGSEWPGRRNRVFPAANLYETEDAYVLTTELPGMRPDSIQIALEGNTLTLGGERSIGYGDGKTSVHRLERQSGRFRRAFELPADVDPDRVDATHRNGVLMLRLPKAAEHRPRQVTVRPG